MLSIFSGKDPLSSQATHKPTKRILLTFFGIVRCLRSTGQQWIDLQTLYRLLPLPAVTIRGACRALVDEGYLQSRQLPSVGYKMAASAAIPTVVSMVLGEHASVGSGPTGIVFIHSAPSLHKQISSVRQYQHYGWIPITSRLFITYIPNAVEELFTQTRPVDRKTMIAIPLTPGDSIIHAQIADTMQSSGVAGEFSRCEKTIDRFIQRMAEKDQRKATRSFQEFLRFLSIKVDSSLLLHSSLLVNRREAEKRSRHCKSTVSKIISAVENSK